MRKMISKIVLAACLAFIVGLFHSCNQQPHISEEKVQSMVDLFQSPDDENTVWCYWYWINDDISKEGITRDLEAMKKAGIGAAFIGNINPAGVDGKVPLFSDEWWDCMVHAVTEGQRIGVDIGTFNCPGWSQSGGPWVKHDMAMRYLAFSETKVNGPGAVEIRLPKPDDEFQDTHTLAFKIPDGEDKSLITLPVNVAVTPYCSDPSPLTDGDENTAVELEKDPSGTISLEFNLEAPLTARQISITPSQPFKCDGELYAGPEGEEKLIRSFAFDRSNFSVNVGPVVKGPVAIALPDVRSDRFKLVLKNFSGGGQKTGLAEVNITEAAVLERFIEKQLGKMHPDPAPEWNSYVWEIQEDPVSPSLLISEVLDISDKMDEEGLLSWDVPEGEWNIMRIGMTPTGTENSPSAPQGQGYEVDKMNSELVRIHFENFVGELLKRIPEESKPAFKYVIADSYEMGSQNWTDGFEVKFREKYGYDPVKYLPVLSGRIVGSVEESERFLWDLRRSVADDIAYEYVGGLKTVSNEHNLQTWLENYGHWGFPSEFMMYGGQSDLIGGEFWNEGTLGNIECKASSSTSHAYGKGRTSAEAFTAAGRAYLRHPAELKKRGDWSFTEGINHLVLHVYIHQPDDERVPGMNAWFSTEFNRHNTWFDQADHYIDYLRRCQYMLQEGKYVADVCYFIGESAPIMTGGRIPEIPEGYSYDYINGEVILDRLTVEDGKFVLPDGMSYRIMVLPPLKTMRPELLAKIKKLVAMGGVILGSPPEKSPSLENYPACDEQVRTLAAELWGTPSSGEKVKHPYEKGFVLEGYDLESAFEFLQLEKDVETGGAPVLWTHRSMPGMDIYFLTNQSDDAITFSPSFRVSGMKPQLWDAVTGEVRHLSDYQEDGGRTVVPLQMEGRRSWFVVFANRSVPGIRASWQNNFPEFSTVKTIEGPFEVDFLNKETGPSELQLFDSLESWTASTYDPIKYYSGTAVYTTTFSVDELSVDAPVYLNLGDVQVVAEVTLNGSEAGGVWIAPYRLNVTSFLKEGTNELEIRVANLWRNRLIKDKMLPEEERYTWTVVDDIAAGEKLRPSGLLGPVTLETAELSD